MNAHDPHRAVESFSRTRGPLATTRSGYFTLTERLALGHAVLKGTAQRVKVTRQLLGLD